MPPRTSYPRRARWLALLAVAGPLGLPVAHATDGYFSHGYGMKAKGMGGAVMANDQDAFAGANNPAAAATAGNRMEGGVDVFMPSRGIERTGGGLNVAVDSGSKVFYVPEFAYNRAITPRLGAGITVYGNGGMNTNYAGGNLNCGAGPANALCGVGNLGVDLVQLVVAPTLAYKAAEAHAFGVSPLLVYQQFKMDGLQAFDNPGAPFPNFTGTPGKVTNKGYDHSTGLGVRLGYLGRIHPQWSVGASYAPKIRMSAFSSYAGLFANSGRFDIPANLALGTQFAATPRVNLALDYQRIYYSGVPAIGNPSTPPTAPLGAPNGPGFGWRDIGVWKLGVEWAALPNLTLRAGYNRSQNPVQSRDVTFNILAPGVTTAHLTLGGTYALSKTTELTVAYMHAPQNSVSGTSMFDSIMGAGAGGTERLKMSQNSLGVQFGWHY